MKVKIRNYVDYFGPYQFMEKVFFWMMEEDEYGLKQPNDRLEKMTDWYAESWLGGFHAKWAGRFSSWRDDNRAKIRIDIYDTWNMDSTLAHIILPMLKQLKEQKHGAPYVDFEDRPEHLIPEGEQDPYDTDEFHFDAWDWVMDEMIFAFESKFNEWEDQFHTGKLEYLSVPLDKDMNELGPGTKFGERRELDPEIEEKVHCYRMDHGPNDTSHFDKDGHRAYQKRITRGFTLFGKYYEGLWD